MTNSCFIAVTQFYFDSLTIINLIEAPQEKKKSKKMKKAEEDAELDALLGGMGIDTKTADENKSKDTKADTAKVQADAGGDGKSKN